MRRLLPLLLLLSLAGCSASANVSVGEKTASTEKIEKEIAASIKRAADVTVKSVKCPEKIKGKKGVTFKCTATGADGTSVTSSGEITSAKGSGRFSYNTPILFTGKEQTAIANGIKEQTGIDVEVDCPDLVALEQGAKSTCKATSGGDTRDVVVTQKDAQGNIDYKLN